MRHPRILATVPEFPYYDRCYWWKNKIQLVRRPDSITAHPDIEPVIEEIITHESLHHVLHYTEGWQARDALDNIQAWDGTKIIFLRNEEIDNGREN